MHDPVLQALSRIRDQLQLNYPGLFAILDRVRMGADEATVMADLMQYVRDCPEVEAVLVQMAQEEVAKAHSEGTAALVPLDAGPQENPPNMMRGPGLARLNPLVEAALVERVQFDGDAPELRTGPLPPGVRPAVPVKTKVRDPAALGRMLQQASTRVQKEIRKLEGPRVQAIEDIVAENGTLKAIRDQGALVVAREEDSLPAVLQGSAETDHSDYRRGMVPTPVRARRPSGSALARMTPEDRRTQAFHFFSSTQGRQTAIPIIRELVATHLRSEGVTVREEEFDPAAPKQTPLACHEWAVTISGSGATQPAFSVIDVAARALAKGLRKQLGEVSACLALQIAPINQMDLRTVGWAARLVS